MFDIEDVIYKRRFRGYDTEDKCWRYGGLFTYETCRVCFAEDVNPNYIKTCIAFTTQGDWNMADRVQYCDSIDPESVGQCTGFKDSEGNDIFEGDILHVAIVLQGDKYPSDFNVTVIWDEKDGRYMVEGWSDDIRWNLSVVASKSKIISNTYEIPKRYENAEH